MKAPEVEIQQSLNDPRLQLAIYTATGRLIDNRANVVNAGALPDYQALRNEANALKKHTIENLDYYLEELESNRGQKEPDPPEAPPIPRRSTPTWPATRPWPPLSLPGPACARPEAGTVSSWPCAPSSASR